MAMTRRELRLDITASAQKAIKTVTDLGREIDDATGKAKGSFDAMAFNDNVRQSVGVLGDIDTAMQTLGSTLGIEGAQIIGDLFAIGESGAQLAGALPLLVSGFAGVLPVIAPLLPILAPLAVGIGAVALAMKQHQDEVERLEQAYDRATKAVSEYAKTVDDMSRNELEQSIAQLELQREVLAQWDSTLAFVGGSIQDNEQTMLAFYETTQKLQEAVKELDEQAFEQFADNLRQFSNLTQEEADNLIRIKQDQLAIEEQIYAEAVERFGETSEQARNAAQGIDELNSELQYLNETDFSKTSANISKLREEGFNNLNSLIDGVGGIFGKIKDKVIDQTTDYYDAAVQLSEQQQKEMLKKQEEAQREAERLAREQQRLLEQQERERQRALEKQERDLTTQLESIADFERRRFEIEQGYRDATFEATLNNDVLSFLSAGRERERALEQATAGLNVGTINVNMGEIATPTDVANAQEALVNALTQVLQQQAGTF